MTFGSAIGQAGRIVSLRGIEKGYLGSSVFSGLDLDLQAGNFYALLGENGAGKSTLIRILAHREPVAAGSGLVLGVQLDRDLHTAGDRLACVADTDYLPPDERIADLLRVSQRVIRNWDPETASRLLEGFHLDPARKVGELSRGQRVQLSLVLSLAYRPELILLDDVTSELDPRARVFLMRELLALTRAGATVLLATNSVEEVEGYATAYVLIADHRVKLNAPARAIGAGFRKLLRPPTADHAVFRCSRCVEVSRSARGEGCYLIPAEEARSWCIPEELLAADPIRPAEMVAYHLATAR